MKFSDRFVMLRVSPALLIVILVFGCGKRDTRPSEGSAVFEDTVPNNHSFADIKGGEKPFKAELHCASSTCPEGVGLIVSLQGSPTPVTCTGFKKPDGNIVTNSHCIPNDIGSGESCLGRIYFVTLKTKTLPSETVGCAKVISKTQTIQTNQEGSPRYALGPDLAVIQLTKAVSQNPIVLSDKKLTEGDIVNIIKVSSEKKIADGELKVYGGVFSDQCTVSYNDTLLNPDQPNLVVKRTPQSPNCNIQTGNSGAPIVDSQGFAHGVVQSTDLTNTNEGKFLGTNFFRRSSHQID